MGESFAIVRNKQTLTLEIPEVALLALSNGHSTWEGAVIITRELRDNEKSLSRISAITNAKQQAIGQKDYVRASVDERKVVGAWNRSDYIAIQEKLAKEGQRESRNFAVPFGDIRKILPVVRKAIKALAVDEILRSMGLYFEYCKKGEHIWKQHNYGFKTVEGFLVSLLEHRKKGQKPRWDTDQDVISIQRMTRATDKHPRLTKRIAKSYGLTFLRTKAYDPSTSDYQHFQQAAIAIDALISYYAKRKIQLTQAVVLEALLSCIVELFNEDTDVIYPAHFSNQMILEKVLPQYLEEQGYV